MVLWVVFGDVADLEIDFSKVWDDIKRGA